MSAPRFLVTAGNTREPIDRVRDWGNIFTGNTGLSIAVELAKIGRVDLLTSNAAHRQSAPAGIDCRGFVTHAQLKSALADLLGAHRYDAIFMTAAVSDYSPQCVYEVIESSPLPDGEEQWIVRNVQAGKVKSHHRLIAVLGRPTEKLVDLFRGAWNHRGLLFKFKLEVGITAEQLIDIGQASRRASGADYLVANTLDMVEGASAGAYLLDEGPPKWIARTDLARTLAQVVKDRLAPPAT